MMASHVKDGSSYLDGISVRVSSKFLPPRPVALPLAHSTAFSDDLLAEKYDFTFERKVLDSIQMRKVQLKTKCDNQRMKSDVSHVEAKSDSVADPSVLKCVVSSWQSDSILQPKPQQISDTIPVLSEPTTKINLSDFENDTSSPFDLMELKTINDLEELNSVFQGLGNKIPTHVPSENTLENNGNVSKSVSFPLPQSSYYVSPEKISNSWSDSFKAGTDELPNNFCKNLPNQTLESHEKIFYESIPLPSNLNQNPENNTLHSKTYPTSYDCTVPGLLPQCDHPTTNLDHPKMVSPNQLDMSPHSTVLGAMSDFVPDTFYRLSQVPYISSSKGLALKTSKSYSDIHTLHDSDWVTKEKKRSLTPPSIEYAGYHNEIFSEDSSLQIKNYRSANSNICDNETSGYSDPYDELGVEEKGLVDSITEMGFSHAQVARAVRHLGSDDKKVVEHLCQIQMLEESGYESFEAEAALHLHDYNQEQAKIFLDLVIQIQELGFEKNAVKKALVQNKNDWNKTIDSLLPSQ